MRQDGVNSRVIVRVRETKDRNDHCNELIIYLIQCLLVFAPQVKWDRYVFVSFHKSFDPLRFQETFDGNDRAREKKGTMRKTVDEVDK